MKKQEKIMKYTLKMKPLGNYLTCDRDREIDQ